jgi:UDP-N-acetyl-D-mannosaminuronate dehydrogenase
MQERASSARMGLGYVGLPLAMEFGKRRPVVGYELIDCKVERQQGVSVVRIA